MGLFSKEKGQYCLKYRYEEEEYVMKKISILALAFCTWILGCILGGCGKTDNVRASENHNLIVIAGNHAGSLKPTYKACESSIMERARTRAV